MASGGDVTLDSSHEYEPLDTLQIKVCSKNGLETMVSAIHIGFMETRFFVRFKMPPIPNTENNDEEYFSAEEEEWLEYMAFLEEDLHWLLKLPHQRFWSQIVYDESLHCCLESYLSQAPRDFDIDSLNLRKELSGPLKNVHKLVFLVYLRMSTHKESKKHHIRPEAFGDIIYDNFIFDIPKVMDLCALYGIQNSSIVSKMVQNIFSTQPKYKDDLDETSKIILTAFNTIEEKLQSISSQNCDTPENEELSLYQDMISYIADVSITIFALTENYSPACQIFHQNGAISRIPTFYEQVFPIIEKEAAKKTKHMKSERTLEDIKRKVTLSKTSLIKIFRNILNYTCFQNILDSKMQKDNGKMTAVAIARNFLEVIIELLPYRNFLSDYNLLYPFDTDLELFNELGIDLDSERVNYIFCQIYDFAEVPEKLTSSISHGARPKVKKEPENSSNSVKDLHGLADMLRTKSTISDEMTPPTSNGHNFSKVEINSLIQTILDILPDLGDGFILECLKHFEYDSEKVIHALLSDSLPDHLYCLDRNMERVINTETRHSSSSILAERKNVFDNDEFDVFSRNDVNMQNIHIGKKNKTPDTYQSLQMDEESEFIKHLTLTLGFEEEDSNSTLNVYEDEYDDTYDSTIVGLKEPPLEDEPEVEDPNENKESEDPEVRPSNPRDFCINPEILRERAEQRRQARGSFPRGGNRGSRSSDQGNNRQHKDRNKAHVGNHNRRKQADFKRSRGMSSYPT